ncbi:uncharacterized protein LOC142008330 [Carettochelys insculpta]|uniref:uncharacterized protein LOC142008330 n=1 Tax=Carettochelys insculpta TaxID=44489 RepID=UPI003EBD6C5B
MKEAEKAQEGIVKRDNEGYSHEEKCETIISLSAVYFHVCLQRGRLKGRGRSTGVFCPSTFLISSLLQRALGLTLTPIASCCTCTKSNPRRLTLSGLIFCSNVDVAEEFVILSFEELKTRKGNRADIISIISCFLRLPTPDGPHPARPHKRPVSATFWIKSSTTPATNRQKDNIELLLLRLIPTPILFLLRIPTMKVNHIGRNRLGITADFPYKHLNQRPGILLEGLENSTRDALLMRVVEDAHYCLYKALEAFKKRTGLFQKQEIPLQDFSGNKAKY